MDYRIIYGIAIVFLLVELFVTRIRLAHALKHLGDVLELMEKQHNHTSSMAKSMFGWYETAKKSNDLVDEHYEKVQEQYENVMTLVKLCMTNNKEENKNGMAV